MTQEHDTQIPIDPDKLLPWPVKNRPRIVAYDPFGKPFEDEKTTVFEWLSVGSS